MNNPHIPRQHVLHLPVSFLHFFYLNKQKSLYWPGPPITIVHHNKLSTNIGAFYDGTASIAPIFFSVKGQNALHSTALRCRTMLTLQRKQVLMVYVH